MASTLTEARVFAFYGAQSAMFGLALALPLAVLPLAVVVGADYALQALAYWSTFALVAHASLRHGRRVLALTTAPDRCCPMTSQTGGVRRQARAVSGA